ncbi:hypothetical protein DCAR_0625897 [Daucus carota subsp. sativus]|uniref:Glycosyltransferase n=1 Tax=Daucus carota subsp. sativus TaxID=79200 RepID=A0A164WR66_DAUCS|nr:PREDICTED: zeatin O-glucosyltransferase-like isoform X1 [Daucus carota subsp. sativus]XP_017258090.1 PREDICTED: zeatin O-glucosyltransferase-like isoform X1 [Daucus carota subsp. sativus]WOH06469.1 hypothetical protein DCAR_0625897 [Daucus carota subsp. sativus]
MASLNNHNHQSNGESKSPIVVVMVPFPAQSHLNQLLHLSRLISPYNIPIHYVSTPSHIRQAKSRLQNWNLNSANDFHIHEFAIPSFEALPPNPNDPTKFPTHLLPMFHASRHLQEPVTALLQSLAATAHRVVVIHDVLISSVVQEVTNIPNAEAYALQSVSVFNHFSTIWEMMGKPLSVQDEAFDHLLSQEGCVPMEFIEILMGQSHLANQFASGVIHNTSKAIEGKYVEFLDREEFSGGIKQWALGPFNPISIPNEEKIRHKCLTFLDKQSPGSVIYVSFGTTISFTDEQIQELALGLEKSEQTFIWVLRDADRGDIYAGPERKAELPTGFEDRIKERGMIVRDWVPQLEILAHPSTGGFMSHCGWNSCLDSITMGVPIAAWPMHSDQPRNAMLVVDILKMGTFVNEWAKRSEVVGASEIAKAVRKLMASEEGDENRKRAVEMGAAVKQSLADGGVTRMELDSFVAHISRI